MNSSVSWLGPSLLTLAGALVGALAPTTMRLLDRRTERRRLSRAEKLEDYPGLARAADKLARLPVWPADGDDPHRLYEDVEAFAFRIGFASPARVSEQAAGVLDAASALADTITAIRTDGRPGHRNTLDQESARRHGEALTRLTEALDAFTEAGRRDLEAKGRAVPIQRDTGG